MKIYTTSGPEVNKKIQEQMDLIIEEIRRETPGILSIMLAGSFGQGEGAVKKVGEEIIPFNDYDVYIISHKKLENKKVDKIIKNISRKINVASFSSYKFTKEKRDLKNTFYLDLKSFSTDNLKKVLPRLRNYSMKKATTILWGKDCRNLIPDYKLKEIPLSDAAKILLDRMNQLVEYYSIKEKPNQDIISYKIQTAYSACATSLLMLSQKFDSSYVKSMEILEKTYKTDFPELYEKLPDLHLRLKKYIKWKLNPEKSLFKDIEKELLKTINDILEVAKYFFSKFLNKKISNIDELSSAILNMGNVFYKPYIKKKFNLNGEFLYDLFFRVGGLFLKYKYFLNIRKNSRKYYFNIFYNKYTPDLYISASTPYLIYYMLNKDKKILNKLRNLLKKVYPLKSKTWEGISMEYRKAYLSFFLQELG